MSSLALVFFWVLCSCIVTPFVGALISRMAGANGDSVNSVNPSVSHAESEDDRTKDGTISVADVGCFPLWENEVQQVQGP